MKTYWIVMGLAFAVLGSWSTGAQPQSSAAESSIKLSAAEAGQLKDAIALRRQGNPEALPRLKQLAQNHPNDYRIQYNHALALAQANQLEDAEQAFLHALDLKAKATISDRTIYNSVGWFYYLQGKDAQARDWLEKARDSAEKTGSETEERIFNNLGVVYLRQGEYGKAREALAEAAKRGSKRAQINLALVDQLDQPVKTEPKQE